MKNTALIFLFLLLSVCGYGQTCTLSVALSSSGGTAICPGGNLVLTATPSAGTAPYTYVWSTGDNTPNITINKAGTYTVTVSDNTAGCQPVSQNITIVNSTAPDAPTAANQSVCQNNSVTLTATAPGGAYQWYDAPSGGNFLASGASYTTPDLTFSATYYVQTTIGGCTSTRAPVSAFVIAKPVATGDTVCSGSNAVLTASGSDSYVWYDAASGGNVLSTSPTLTTAPLTTTTTFYVTGTAFGCTSSRVPVIAKVNPPPQAPTASNVTICSGSVANLHASAAAGVFDWFNVPSGGTSLISSPDFTTPTLTTTTTYYVQNTLNQCVSPRTPVTVTVEPNPSAPANQNDTICPHTSVTLTASTSPSGTYQWYDAATGGNLLTTGVTYTTPVLNGSATYYVQNSNASCSSPRASIQVMLSEPPAAPSASEPLICQGTSVTLTATSPGGTYEWYNAAAGGKLLITGASYTTPDLASNTTYYVQTTINGCVSARTAVTVSVIPPAAGPSVSGNTTVCSGNATTLTASGGSGSYNWYDAATGGNYLSSGQVYITPALSTTTTFYVSTTNATGCESVRTPATVTVNQTPDAPTATGTPVCPGSPETLTASGSGTIEWYDAATGGKLLTTGNTYTTPPISSNTTYYIQSTSGTCTSTRAPVIASVISVTNPQFEYPAGTFCPSSAAKPKPVINNPSGGTFSASPAGLVFLNINTGQIDIAASLPGHYVVSFAGNGTCPTTSTAGFTITSAPDAQFSYSGPYCLDQSNPSPVFAAGASAGVFSASPSGLVFLDTSTGEIDFKSSKAGTYTITNTIAANAGCPSASANTTVILYQPVNVSAGPNQTVLSGSPVQLAGSISGGAKTGTWSGGTGTFSDPSLLNAVYTPAASENVVTLTLTSSDPAGPCGPKSAQVTITINNSPAAPTAASQVVCSGSTAVLSATAPGGTYRWYDAATGGNLLFKGPNFTTPAITVNTTYYVQTTFGGLTSSRTAVTVTVSGSSPAPSVAAVPPVCSGSSATLVASGSASGYEWYDAAVGGNLLSTDGTYVTPALTANTSYFVQAAGAGCQNGRTQVNVLVLPLPNITSSAADNVCSGNPESYTITADIASTTFSWSRAQVAGISNPAATNQPSASINETLINTTNTAINVTYVIIATANGCSNAPFNYVVTVYPNPQVTSAATSVACSGSPVNYAITFNDPTITYTWSRAANPGISNSPVSGQSSATIQEVLNNTTNAPVNVTYVFNYKTSTCDGVPFNMVVTVNPQVLITSAGTGTACSGVPQGYPILSNVPSATFNWSRAKVNGISNPAVTNQTTPTIEETLINTGLSGVKVTYIITPTANGCPGTPFTYTVVVNPEPTQSVATSNSPVCTGSSIQLNTPAVAKATYMWTGPNGFTSPSQNPIINNVTTDATGTYSLFVLVNGCISPPATVDVTVDELPLANAGVDQTACIDVPSIQLAGTVTGGTTTGIWTTGGSGTFTPSSADLNAQYLPSTQDKAKGSVKITLASTSKDDCNISTSSFTITFKQVPGDNAGPDQNVCSQATTVKLNGTILTTGGGSWSTSGTGTFSPSATALDANYIPSAQDIKNDSVKLVLLATSANECYIPTDTMVIHFIPPPSVNAGGTRYVLKGNTITLNPTVSDNNVHYLWSPDVDINNDTLKNPVITGDIDRSYTLTVTDSRGCVNSDQTFIKVSPELSVPNAFTPNGDGVNDIWNIQGLIAYFQASVDIFNRYGTKLYHSIGYNIPWDGTYNGKPVPAGTYYYVIDTKVNGLILSGYVSVIR